MVKSGADQLHNVLDPNYTLDGNKSILTAEDLSTELKTTILPVTCLIGIEICLGITGNIFILIIYSLRYRRCNFKYFVLCMALIDLTSCVTTLPGEIYSQLHWYDYKYEWICKTKSFFNVSTVWSSALTLLCLAHDRYRKICRPLDSQIHPSLALRLCIISIVVSAVISTPVAILWGKQTYIHGQGPQNITVTICEKSDYFADGKLPFLFIVIAYMTPIAFTILIINILNFKIAKTIFVSIPVPKKGSLSMDERNYDTRNADTEVADEPEKRCHVKKDSSQDNLCQKSEQTRICENESALDTISEFKSNGNFQNLPAEKTRTNLGGIYAQQFDFSTCITDRIKRFKTRRHSSNSSDTSGFVSFCKLKHCRLSTSSTISNNRPFRKRISKHYSRGDLGNSNQSNGRISRLKHKTEIMLILTSVFTITVVIYLILVSFVASEHGILKRLTANEKVLYFLFWRFYFINCLINPFLYGIMDPRFRKGIKDIFFAKFSFRRRSTKSSITSV